MEQRQRTASNSRPTAASGEPATDGGSRSLWFNPPIEDPDRRPQLTRERIVTEALAVIAQDGVQALTMRSLAARLGVVPGALYHHVGNKQHLQDLLLDGILAEIDFHTDPSLAWTQHLKALVLLQATFACPCRGGCLRLGSQLRRGEQRQWTSLTG